MLESITPHMSDLPAYGRLALWFTIGNALLEILAMAFGPFVQATFPKAYGPLAALGKGLRDALNNASSLMKLLGPVKAEPSQPPKPRVPPLPLLLVMALCLGACKSPYPVDGCIPHEMRCANGAPQVCSGSRRWTSSSRGCSTPDTTCCWTGSQWDGRPITACVPPQLCLSRDGGQ